eukprot:gb/GECG01003393.1/.p1 GENE.gb/GECG01003393.1/~~gb/GECG01003393.1/.p1  ORF type:complete len:226 (+),score=41.44 gb/GECG01003393.1/:1-678(+)
MSYASIAAAASKAAPTASSTATVNTRASGSDSDAQQVLSRNANSLLKVTTSSNETFEGKLIGYDPASRTAVFQHRHDDKDQQRQQHGDATQQGFEGFRFITDKNITNLQVLRPLSEDEKIKLPHPQIDKIKEKESFAERRYREAIDSVNAGASDFGQFIFDEIKKTMPCQWKESRIVVMDAVCIDPPYDESHVSPLQSGATDAAVSRVKYVLQKSREKWESQAKK